MMSEEKVNHTSHQLFDTGDRDSSAGRSGRNDRLESRPEASSPLICVRMKPCSQPPDFCASPILPRLSLLPFRALIPHVSPPLTSPAGCLGPVAAAGRFFPGAGPGRTESARI